jgi:hypothetical protein
MRRNTAPEFPPIWLNCLANASHNSFTPEGEDKPVTGVEITQQTRSGAFDKKVSSHFHFQDGVGKWKAKNGFPLPDGDTREYTSDDWQLYFAKVRRFLVEFVKTEICPKFESWQAAEGKSTGIEYPDMTEENAAAIPF